MKKFALFNLSCFALLPSLSIALTCVPYSRVQYALQANGATGTLTKTQTCTGDGSNGAYTITSDIHVTKAIFSKEINQTAQGTYASPNTINAQSFLSSSNAGATLPAGNLDTLALVLYLSSSLNSNSEFSPHLPVFYNNSPILVDCSANTPVSVTTASGSTVPATSVTCATPDNSVVLGYAFAQDSAMMLEATATENGTQTLSAIINDYP